MPLVLRSEQHWVCPNCNTTAVTTGQDNRWHSCPGLKLLTAPMVLEGIDCKVFATEREDYIGKEIVQYDAEGRPITSVITERADGSNDVIVNLPTAQAIVEM